MTRERMIQGLNEDLSAELGTIIRYTYQAGKSCGLMGEEFRELLEREIPDEIRHATFLTDVIVDYGGEPTTAPKMFERRDGLKEMINLDLEMETHDVDNYKRHARWAEEMGDIELKVRLEEMASDESRHARELRRMMRGFNGSVRPQSEAAELAFKTISRDEFIRMWGTNTSGARLVDVLSAENFAQEHIKGAINIPVDRIDELAPKLLKKNEPVIVYCGNFECPASSLAAQKLVFGGFKAVFDYKGGLKDYKETSLPLEGRLHQE